MPGLRLIRVVAPLTGAWIEISFGGSFGGSGDVAPLTGAWIEMHKSLGLYYDVPVAPLTGAWIEISRNHSFQIRL